MFVFRILMQNQEFLKMHASMHPGKFLKALEFPLLFKGLESSGNLMSASWKVLGFLCFKFDKFRLHFVRVQLKNYGHCLSAV